MKPSSAIAAHDAPLTPPRRATQVDWEVELAVVIGTRCRDVSVDDALGMVAGYMTANDISVRHYAYEFERDESSIHPFFDWLAGKWGDGFAPFGPYLVGADEVPDPGNLELHLDINGEVRQAGSTSELIFNIAQIISYASSIMTLEPGDVIETGTTGGAGVETGVYVKPGDVMTARVGDLGEIRTLVLPWANGVIDLAIRGGTVVDGTGSVRRVTDIGIHDGVIVAMEDVPAAAHEVDATGLIVAPGFVDIHSHSDLALLGDPRGESKVLQGVTTEVVGNCGLSVAPVSHRGIAELLRPLMSYCEDSRVAWTWTDIESYLARVADARPLVDVAILAGHNTIRASVLGLEARHATAEERDRMAEMLDTAMLQGARGLSLGLMYPPSSYADHEELVSLGRVLARHGGILASHMADYGSRVIEAVEAMVRVGEEAGCRIQISHLAVSPRENWGLVARALEIVDAAVERGVDVGVDIYPYLAGSTNLSQTLPLWSLEGGFERFRERVIDPATRAKVLDHLEARTMGWDEVLLVAADARPEFNGLSVDEAARTTGQPPASFVLELLQVCDPTIVAFGRSEDDLLDVLRHPRSVIGSDGLAVAIQGTVGGPVPHPRFFGTYPALLQKYVRETGALTLEDAIHKCTEAPARRFGFTDRGRIAEGTRGDVVLIDLETVADRSTYSDSRRAPDGIVAVFREGLQIAADGQLTLERFPTG